MALLSPGAFFFYLERTFKLKLSSKSTTLGNSRPPKLEGPRTHLKLFRVNSGSARLSFPFTAFLSAVCSYYLDYLSGMYISLSPTLALVPSFRARFYPNEVVMTTHRRSDYEQQIDGVLGL